MKIIKSTSNSVVSSLTKSANDQSFDMIMEYLNQVEQLIHTIDPVQYPDYVKSIFNRLNGITHTFGGVLETQNPPVNPNQINTTETGLG